MKSIVIVFMYLALVSAQYNFAPNYYLYTWYAAYPNNCCPIPISFSISNLSGYYTTEITYQFDPTCLNYPTSGTSFNFNITQSVNNYIIAANNANFASFTITTFNGQQILLLNYYSSIYGTLPNCNMTFSPNQFNPNSLPNYNIGSDYFG